MRGHTNLPFIRHRLVDTEVDLGGQVMKCTASGALKLGQVVVLTGTRTVATSTTLADHSLVCGVVVGGANFDNKIVVNSALYNGNAAADNGEDVLVQFSGICYVICAAAIVVGTTVIPDTVTAGRVKTSAALAGALGTLAIAAGGVAVTSTAANGAIITGAGSLTGDGYFRAVGKLLQASGSANDIRPILLTLGA